MGVTFPGLPARAFRDHGHHVPPFSQRKEIHYNQKKGAAAERPHGRERAAPFWIVSSYSHLRGHQGGAAHLRHSPFACLSNTMMSKL